MKSLSLTQPWATLVALGAKTIETRSWATRYRGPLAIHAAKGYGPGGRRGYFSRCQYDPFKASLGQHLRILDNYNCFAAPLGAIVAVCELTAIARVDYYEPQIGVVGLWRGPFLNFGDHGEMLPGEPELSFGDYSVGRFIWRFANIHALPEPVPCRGARGLWNLDAATLAAVEGQLTP
jgi:hypothetical protein